MMAPPRLILVGGFLGAGKTTLLWRAAASLIRQGKRVGLITNDQAPHLVDTEFLAAQGLTVQEIAGGCFCCRFDELVATADKLVADRRPDVLLGEPVGSCTDVSATVLQPLKDLFAARYDVAPFSVLVAPHRLEEALDPAAESPLPDSARYIVRKQLEEADRIVVNKIDTLEPPALDALRRRVEAAYPKTPVSYVSALAERGVEDWLAAVLAPGEAAGRRVVDVDYDLYAEGEAVLGWLNATVHMDADGPLDWGEWTQRLIGEIQRRARARQAEIAHLKVLTTTVRGYWIANVTHLGETPSLRGGVSGRPLGAEVVINTRIGMTPEDLQTAVKAALRATTDGVGRCTVATMRSLSPGRPQPVHRYSQAV